jgi:hypothetical protein
MLEVTDACVTLFKHTPEEMALKIDAFITAGLPGVLSQSMQNRPTRIKTEICDLVLSGLHQSIPVASLLLN